MDGWKTKTTVLSLWDSAKFSGSVAVKRTVFARAVVQHKLRHPACHPACHPAWRFWLMTLRPMVQYVSPHENILQVIRWMAEEDLVGKNASKI